MAEKGMNTILVLVLVGLGAWFFLGGGLGGSTSPSTVPSVPTTSTAAVCESSTTPDFDINAYDLENPNTALAEATNIYRLLGSNTWSLFTAGTAITNLQVGKQYEVVLGINTSDATDNAYGKYFITDPIPCAELTSFDAGMYNDEDEAGITVTYYDNDNNAATAEAFAAGEAQDVECKFQATTDEVFGNPFIKDAPGLSDKSTHSRDKPNVFCLSLDVTTWDEPDYVMADGVKLDKVSTPTIHPGNSTDTVRCYEAPVITEVAKRITFKLNADDTNNPATRTLNGTLYSANFYVDTNTGKVDWGVEDNEGTRVSADSGISCAILVS